MLKLPTPDSIPRKNMNIANVKKEDLSYFGYREEPPLISSVMIGGWFDMPKLAKIFGLKRGVRWFQANYNLFEVKDDLIQVEKEIKEILEKRGEKFVSHLNKECMLAGKKLIKFSKKISKEILKGADREEFIVLLKEYFDYLSSYTVFMLLAVFERPVMEIANKLVENRCNNQTDSENLLRLITVPIKQTAVEKEQADFLKLAASKNGNRSALAKKHADKYGWLAIRYFLGNPWTSDDIISRLEHIDANTAKDSLEKKLLSGKMIEKEISQAVKNFSKKEKKMVGMIREVVFLRNHRADILSEAAFFVRPYLLEIARILRLSYEELLNLSIEEIILSLRGEFDYRQHVEVRKNGFVIFHNPEKRMILDGEDYKKYIEKKRFFLMEALNINEFKGMVACKGKVSGTVKIVRAEGDLKKVERNDILVCPMTVPHFISAMEKASAFITDEGGITCHAAIISREMKKPCITATKIATKVLKDGDFVEVDANKGTVKIME
jgi:phosphohistidine swiveling domain-containing protein